MYTAYRQSIPIAMHADLLMLSYVIKVIRVSILMIEYNQNPNQIFTIIYMDIFVNMYACMRSRSLSVFFLFHGRVGDWGLAALLMML